LRIVLSFGGETLKILGGCLAGKITFDKRSIPRQVLNWKRKNIIGLRS
jgi:hypothetical protein